MTLYTILLKHVDKVQQKEGKAFVATLQTGDTLKIEIDHFLSSLDIRCYVNDAKQEYASMRLDDKMFMSQRFKDLLAAYNTMRDILMNS